MPADGRLEPARLRAERPHGPPRSGLAKGTLAPGPLRARKTNERFSWDFIRSMAASALPRTADRNRKPHRLRTEATRARAARQQATQAPHLPHPGQRYGFRLLAGIRAGGSPHAPSQHPCGWPVAPCMGAAGSRLHPPTVAGAAQLAMTPPGAHHSVSRLTARHDTSRKHQPRYRIGFLRLAFAPWIESVACILQRLPPT